MDAKPTLPAQRSQHISPHTHFTCAQHTTCSPPCICRTPAKLQALYCLPYHCLWNSPDGHIHASSSLLSIQNYPALRCFLISRSGLVSNLRPHLSNTADTTKDSNSGDLFFSFLHICQEYRTGKVGKVLRDLCWFHPIACIIMVINTLHTELHSNFNFMLLWRILFKVMFKNNLCKLPKNRSSNVIFLDR